MPARPEFRPRFLALLALAGLAACSSPLTETSYPVQDRVSFEGRTVLVRSRFDPVQRAWYTDVLPQRGAAEAIPREDAVRLVEQIWGPRVCDGAPLRLERRFYSLWDDPQAVLEYPTRGGWQVVADCGGGAI